MEAGRIDLFHLDGWDYTTSADEVMRALGDLVSSGKVVYLSISNTPAWRVSQMQTLAELRGRARLVARQIEYSLAERTIEHELLPMADAHGLGVLAWSPLAGGLLAGKYGTDDLAGATESPAVSGTRKDVIVAMGGMTKCALRIADTVRQIAGEIEVAPSLVALAWLLLRPTPSIPIVGTRTLVQLEGNLGVLDVDLTADQLARLGTVSAVPPIFPHPFIAGPMAQQLIFGGASVCGRR